MLVDDGCIPLGRSWPNSPPTPLVAFAPREPESLGVARFIRDPDSPETAEVAIVVADAWQRRGLGTLLLRELAGRAADVGIKQFTAEILTEYAPTLALLQQLGAADMTRDGSTVAIAIDAKKPMLAKDIGASSLFCRPARMAPDGGQGAARRPRAGRGDGHAGDKGALRRRRSVAPSQPAGGPLTGGPALRGTAGGRCARRGRGRPRRVSA